MDTIVSNGARRAPGGLPLAASRPRRPSRAPRTPRTRLAARIRRRARGARLFRPGEG